MNLELLALLRNAYNSHVSPCTTCALAAALLLAVGGVKVCVLQDIKVFDLPNCHLLTCERISVGVLHVISELDDPLDQA